MLLVKRLNGDAKIPTKNYPSDAGWDLYSDQPVTFLTDGIKSVTTGIQVAIPEGYYGRVAPRSGLAINYGIDTLAGVVDAGYRGEIVVVLHKITSGPFSIDSGSRIAQLVIEKIGEFGIEETATLPASNRGANGWGSSGK